MDSWLGYWLSLLLKPLLIYTFLSSPSGWPSSFPSVDLGSDRITLGLDTISSSFPVLAYGILYFYLLSTLGNEAHHILAIGSKGLRTSSRRSNLRRRRPRRKGVPPSPPSAILTCQGWSISSLPMMSRMQSAN